MWRKGSRRGLHRCKTRVLQAHPGSRKPVQTVQNDALRGEEPDSCLMQVRHALTHNNRSRPREYEVSEQLSGELRAQGGCVRVHSLKSRALANKNALFSIAFPGRSATANI